MARGNQREQAREKNLAKQAAQVRSDILNIDANLLTRVQKSGNKVGRVIDESLAVRV